MSSAENQDIINKFKMLGWEIQSMPGAGNKLLQIALGNNYNYKNYTSVLGSIDSVLNNTIILGLNC